jgi:hypothetical protein
MFRFPGQQFHIEQYTQEKYYTSLYIEIKVLGNFLKIELLKTGFNTLVKTNLIHETILAEKHLQNVA